MAAAAALAFAAPFAFAQPAHAAVNQDFESGFLTFVTFSGVAVTCELAAGNTHDTDAHSAGVSQRSFRSDGASVPECKGDHRVDLAYKDEHGDENTALARVFDSDNVQLGVFGVQGDVRATHTVFFTQCDASQSATCVLTVQTSTK